MVVMIENMKAKKLMDGILHHHHHLVQITLLNPCQNVEVYLPFLHLLWAQVIIIYIFYSFSARMRIYVSQTNGKTGLPSKEGMSFCLMNL
jgi:hypothetical protein